MPVFDTQENVLNRINKLFPRFDLIVDVGAAIGTWSKLAHDIWPEVEILAVEPQPEFVKQLISANSAKHVRNCVISDVCGPVFFNISEDGWSSSLLYEGISRIETEAHTLECIIDDLKLNFENVFIKTDLQGHDFISFKSIGKYLTHVNVVQMECQLAPYAPRMTGFSDRIVEMKKLGFEVYEIFEPLYRPSDSALGQVDVIFLRNNLSSSWNFQW
jgi:FkbM family methyltransferase